MLKKRLVALVASLLLLMNVAGCRGDTRETWIDGLSQQLRALGDRQANTGYLSVHELVQKLADAMRNDNNVTTAYDSIPDRQKDGLSLDQFQQYIRFLRRGVTGNIISFSEMTDQEITDVREQVTLQLPEAAEGVAGLSGFWIHYQEFGRAEEKFAIYVREQVDQSPDLHADWVNQILDLQDLAMLYFDALDRFDQEALTVLLQPRDFPDDIIDLRAEMLIRFYRNNITSRSTEFKVTHARIDRIGFEEFGIINPDQTQAVSRKIEIIRQADSRYNIDDIVPEVLHDEDLQIYFEEKWLMQLGQTEENEAVQVNSGDLESIIGAPLLHDDTVCTTAPNGSQKIELAYLGMKLKAEGTCFRHSRWNGQVSQLTLSSPTFQLGSGIGPGDTEADLLRHYPFARESGYIIRGKTALGNVMVKFNLNEGIITSIDLFLL